MFLWNSQKSGKTKSPPIVAMLVAMTTTTLCPARTQAQVYVWLLTLKILYFSLIMDATKKPLLIPPEFSNYAEKHEVFQTIEVWYRFYCFQFRFYSIEVARWLHPYWCLYVVDKKCVIRNVCVPVQMTLCVRKHALGVCFVISDLFLLI